ncbi:Gfo/Idh/MocA family oxidoreductase [Micrococcales bacterium 31B]|nr:Gfo/Idh/MocA family oxidoreductase [Micrococcales bacterium 31B]
MSHSGAALRGAIIGLGMMGRHHVRVLRSLEGVDLVAVADPGGDVHAVAGDVPVYENVTQLIEHGIDLCVVAVPTIFHEEVALELAAAGVHALIEKPLANDVAGAQRICDAFEGAGLVGAVGHIERFNPAVQEARRRIEAGELGDIYQITTRRQGPFPARIADVGVVLDLATHDIDLTAWVTGRQFASVSANTARRSGRPHEDLVSISGLLETGIVTNHLVNWLSPVKERYTMVTGEKGAFVADTLTADFTFYENGTVPTQWDSIASFRGVSEGNVTRFAIVKREPLLAEQEAFRDAVLGTESHVVTLAQGLRTVTVAQAVLRAAAEGSVVNL